MSQHGRSYANDTKKTMHFEIFKDNVKYVENFNKYRNQTYKLGINRFVDLMNEEVVNYYTTGMLKPTDWASTTIELPFMYGGVTTVPLSMDRRDYGAVST